MDEPVGYLNDRVVLKGLNVAVLAFGFLAFWILDFGFWLLLGLGFYLPVFPELWGLSKRSPDPPDS